jgi:ATP-binding cassette subfamily B protein
MEAEVVVRGNNLSGGQKQRLLIARALAADPEILVLDDASSALDYQTDSDLRGALRKHYRNTTTVLVAQRVSSLRHADLILVLEEGCVIGAGNHETLLESCEEYRLIAHTQMGEGKEAE